MPQPLKGEVTPPGDKSISHRALILGALAKGRSHVTGLNLGADVDATRHALLALGVGIDGTADAVDIHGVDALAQPGDALECGNSGTTMRLLAGVLAAQPFTSRLVGDASLSARPMERIATPLRAMGAHVDTTDGHAPLTIRGHALTGIPYDTPVASAQIKSCVLLAGLFAAGDTIVREPAPSRDHTERMLAAMGADISVAPAGVRIRRGAVLKPLRMRVPGDVSAAAFHLAAAAIRPGSRITALGVGVNPTRAGFLSVLARMGARVTRRNERVEAGEPLADVTVSADGPLRGTVVTAADIPALIDEVPILGIVAACASSPTRIEGAAELRVKESDRLRGLAEGLIRLGVHVEERPDGLTIGGGGFARGGEIDTHGDHRLVMSFEVAALAAPEAVVPSHRNAAAVSDPTFAATLAALERA